MNIPLIAPTYMRIVFERPHCLTIKTGSISTSYKKKETFSSLRLLINMLVLGRQGFGYTHDNWGREHQGDVVIITFSEDW
jgi:hypothetical protein